MYTQMYFKCFNVSEVRFIKSACVKISYYCNYTACHQYWRAL